MTSSSSPRPLPVILAAGMGTRLGREQPKCLTAVHGKPILARTFQALRACGLRDAVLVTGFAAPQLEAFAAHEAPDLALQLVRNHAYADTGTARSLALGLRAAAPTRPVIIIEADVAFEPAVLADLLAHPAPDAVAVEREQPFHSGSVVTIDPGGELTCWYHERTRPATLRSDRAWKTANLNRLAASTWVDTLLPTLARVESTEGARAPAEYAYAELVVRRSEPLGEPRSEPLGEPRSEPLGEQRRERRATPTGRLSAVDIGARTWFEVDTPDDLALAERRFAALES